MTEYSSCLNLAKDERMNECRCLAGQLTFHIDFAYVHTTVLVLAAVSSAESDLKRLPRWN